jgi:hypothetical protein
MDAEWKTGQKTGQCNANLNLRFHWETVGLNTKLRLLTWDHSNSMIMNEKVINQETLNGGSTAYESSEDLRLVHLPL